MGELRRADELRQEHETGEQSTFKQLISEITDEINLAHSKGVRYCDILSIMKGYHGMRTMVDNHLKAYGYSVSFYEDNRDSYYNVNW